MGTHSPPQRGHSSPHFSAHVYNGQAAGWIKIHLGVEASLSPGHIVLDGDPAPSRKGAHQFCIYCDLHICAVYICTRQFHYPESRMHHFSTDIVALNVRGKRPPCEILGGAKDQGAIVRFPTCDPTCLHFTLCCQLVIQMLK